MKRFNLQLTEDQHEWFRKRSFKEDKSMAEIVREIIEQAKKTDETIKEAL